MPARSAPATNRPSGAELLARVPERELAAFCETLAALVLSAARNRGLIASDDDAPTSLSTRRPARRRRGGRTA
ncbi:MAG TPA: hypothetical protein VE953_17020 [Terriglobales bacterium]|nr:hypothetical protein [Terriglobales bacterium]